MALVPHAFSTEHLKQMYQHHQQEKNIREALNIAKLLHEQSQENGDEDKVREYALWCAECSLELSLYDEALALLLPYVEPKVIYQLPKTLQMQMLLTIGRAYFRTGDYQQAFYHANELFGISDTIDKTYKGAAFNLQGAIYGALGVYEEALQCFISHLEIQKGQPSDDLWKTYNNIANVHIFLKQYEEAIKCITEGISQLESGDQAPEIASMTCLITLGHAYKELGNTAVAKSYFQELIEPLEKQHRFDLLILAHQFLGELYVVEENMQVAQGHYHQALNLLASHPNFDHEVTLQVRLAQVKLSTGNLQEAEKRLHDAYILADKHNLKERLQEVYHLSYKLYKHQGALAEALAAHERYYTLTAEIKEQESKNRTRALMIKFDVEGLERERELTSRRNVELEAMVRERTKELEKMHVEMLERLAAIGEKRDDYTGDHTKRVGEVSGRLAQKLKLPPEDVKMIRLAARLHDIGKIAIPDSILLKPARLTDAEYEEIKTHTSIGAEMLRQSASPLLRMAERIALAHHERWDGQGYPQGLGHQEIPIEGRIVSLADVFDALTNERPYKSAWSVEKAIEEISSGAGRQFDPQVVEAFWEIMQEDGYHYHCKVHSVD